MAGYNTTVEVLRAGRPVVMVPRPGPSAEQRTRAALFAARGWVDTVPPERLAPAALGAAVLRALDAPATEGNGKGAHGAPALDGLRVAVDALLEEQLGSVVKLDGVADRHVPDSADDALAV
jgi:predicted glycosyltransferase